RSAGHSQAQQHVRQTCPSQRARHRRKSKPRLTAGFANHTARNAATAITGTHGTAGAHSGARFSIASAAGADETFTQAAPVAARRASGSNADTDAVSNDCARNT